MFEWKDLNVLITGASGFLGSWLSERLVNENANVTMFVKDDSPRIKSIEHLASKANIIRGDLKNKNSLNSALENQDVIFHLGAITQVLYAIKNPQETTEVNINGTLNILENIRRKENETFLVYMSTDKVYGEPDKFPIEEDNLLSAKSPYDASKLAADRMCYCYHKTYGLGVSIARSSNIYGGRESNELRAVSDFVRAVIKSKPPVIRGSGKHERDFIFIDDIVNGLALLAENRKKTNGEVFNFGTGKAISIYDLSKLIIEISYIGKNLEPKVLGRPTPGEIDRQYLSYEKARNMIGWEPKIDLDKGIRLTVEWYKENPWFEEVIRLTSKYYGIGTLV